MPRHGMRRCRGSVFRWDLRDNDTCNGVLFGLTVASLSCMPCAFSGVGYETTRIWHAVRFWRCRICNYRNLAYRLRSIYSRTCLSIVDLIWSPWNSFHATCSMRILSSIWVKYRNSSHANSFKRLKHTLLKYLRANSVRTLLQLE